MHQFRSKMIISESDTELALQKSKYLFFVETILMYKGIMLVRSASLKNL